LAITNQLVVRMGGGRWLERARGPGRTHQVTLGLGFTPEKSPQPPRHGPAQAAPKCRGKALTASSMLSMHARRMVGHTAGRARVITPCVRGEEGVCWGWGFRNC
jgi:hypothetical protein